MKKRRNPADLTGRNLHALKKRIERLELLVGLLSKLLPKKVIKELTR